MNTPAVYADKIKTIADKKTANKIIKHDLTTSPANKLASAGQTPAKILSHAMRKTPSVSSDMSNSLSKANASTPTASVQSQSYGMFSEAASALNLNLTAKSYERSRIIKLHFYKNCETREKFNNVTIL